MPVRVRVWWEERKISKKTETDDSLELVLFYIRSAALISAWRFRPEDEQPLGQIFTIFLAGTSLLNNGLPDKISAYQLGGQKQSRANFMVPYSIPAHPRQLTVRYTRCAFTSVEASIVRSLVRGLACRNGTSHSCGSQNNSWHHRLPFTYSQYVRNRGLSQVQHQKRTREYLWWFL